MPTVASPAALPVLAPEASPAVLRAPVPALLSLPLADVAAAVHQVSAEETADAWEAPSYDPYAVAGVVLESLKTDHGVTVRRRLPDGQSLVVTPKERVTDAVRQIVRFHRADLLAYLADRPFAPVRIRSAALDGETVLWAGDTCDVGEVHAGLVVYRTGEMGLLSGMRPDALRLLHAGRLALLSAWDGHGWHPTRPRFAGGQWGRGGKRAPGFETTVEDLARRARVPMADADRLVDHLCACGIMRAWTPGGEEFVRIVPPEQRGYRPAPVAAAPASSAPAAVQQRSDGAEGGDDFSNPFDTN